MLLGILSKQVNNDMFIVWIQCDTIMSMSEYMRLEAVTNLCGYVKLLSVSLNPNDLPD